MIMTTYSVTEFCHLLVMTGADGTLVVTEDGNLSIAVIVKLHLLGDTSVRSRVLGDLFQEVCLGPRCIVGTEDLGSQALHVVVQVFIQLRCLENRVNECPSLSN